MASHKVEEHGGERGGWKILHTYDDDDDEWKINILIINNLAHFSLALSLFLHSHLSL